MNLKDMGKVQKMTFSAMIMAVYVVLVYITQSFSFGAYQIRIATSVYALAYLFPFLVIPLGLANFIANMLGGFGIIDMVGGFIVGIVTSGIVMLIKKFHLPRFMIFFPITIVPGLGVALWLSPMVHMPYGALALSLCIGQTVPAVCGVALSKALEQVFYPKHSISNA